MPDPDARPNVETAQLRPGPRSQSARTASAWWLFWTTGAAFLLLILLFVLSQNFLRHVPRFFELAILPAAVLMLSAGLALVIATTRAPFERWLKQALLWTGISALGIPLSAVLHNVVYGLVILIFGKNAWGGTAGAGDGDEPVFFILALIIFPLLLIISFTTGTVIYLRRRKL